MRIGFDVSQTGPGKAGCGFYAHGLLHGLLGIDAVNDYVLYPTFGDHYFDPEVRSQELPVQQNVTVGPHQQHPEARMFWGNPAPGFESRIGNPDVIHANNFFAPAGLIHSRLVYTLYDLGFLENSSWTTEANRTACFGGLFRAAVSADWMIAISRFTKQRFTHLFPHYPADRISVIYPASRFGPNHPATPPAAKLERRKFWLCVATLEPRKNYRGILRAYGEVRADIGPAADPLVIAGGAGWITDIQQEIDQLKLGGHVVLLGYVPDAVLCWLYRNARCLVFPSFYEGFGMPVLEAMSCGTPVIASNGSAFPEIVGSSQPGDLLVDPLDVASIAGAMKQLQRLTADRMDRLGILAQQQAQSFSWQQSANALLQVYQQALDDAKLFR